MKNFEDLKSQWENQTEINIPSNGSKLIIEKVDFVKKNQRITNIILGTTAAILIGFFFYIAAYSNLTVTIAMLVMIGALITRILIELVSIKKLKHLDVTTNASEFKQQLIHYHKRRMNVHYIFTPIIIVLYAIGFIILLPFFKETLSSGFYTYIQVSSVVILVVLIFFIRKQILKELAILKELSS